MSKFKQMAPNPIKIDYVPKPGHCDECKKEVPDRGKLIFTAHLRCLGGDDHGNVCRECWKEIKGGYGL